MGLYGKHVILINCAPLSNKGELKEDKMLFDNLIEDGSLEI